MPSTPVNVDLAELAKFESLAHRWWDPQGEFKPLHDINPLRLDYIDRHAMLAGKDVLDVGCGGGILTEAMAKAGARVVGIDLAEGPLAAARLHLKDSDLTIDYRNIAVEELAAAQPESFDVVTCMEMLEHVPDPAAIVLACATAVRSSGDVFFSTINRNPKAFLFAIIGAEYLLRLLPAGTHDFSRFIRPAELGQWTRSSRLEVADITGLSYNPITRGYRLGRDLSVNYMLHARKA
jgi:2-polyprenyl-6-hydroxyphenyl methylase / 3-demethylubiquinone-9 3-methyltransferase